MKWGTTTSTALLSLGSILGVACAHPDAASPANSTPPTALAVSPQIIGPNAEGTPKELRDAAERDLLAQKYKEARTELETLIAAEKGSPDMPALLYDLASAEEGLEDIDAARVTYREIADDYATTREARGALAKEALLDAYLEDWARLGQAAAALLARTDVDDVDKITGLGSRGLSEAETGNLRDAERDVQNGLDIVDSLHYGAAGRLPVPAAQLRFALGETRRLRSEEIKLDASPEFLQHINLRCDGLLAAQSAYSDAIRSVDPHWAAMSGERVGEMYRALHHDLMLIPAPHAKTENDRQLFYGMMHVRYRVLLEKGIEMMKRTVDFADKSGVPSDSSAWVKRAETAKKDMELALEDEKTEIAKSPFTEEELEKALAVTEAKVKKAQAAQTEKANKQAAGIDSRH